MEYTTKKRGKKENKHLETRRKKIETYSQGLQRLDIYFKEKIIVSQDFLTLQAQKIKLNCQAIPAIRGGDGNLASFTKK